MLEKIRFVMVSTLLIVIAASSITLAEEPSGANVNAAATEHQAAPVDGSSEAAALEKRIDTLIAEGREKEADEAIKDALQRYPNHKGIEASREALELKKALTKWVGVGATWLVAGASLALIVVVAVIVGLYHKGQQLLAVGVYLTAVFVLALPLGLGMFLIMYVATDLEKSPDLPGILKHGFRLAIASYLGAVGGALNGSIVYSHRHRHEIPAQGNGMFAYFFYKPIHGFFLALVMYLAVVSGQLAAFPGERTVPSLSLVALMAALTGIFSDAAIQKLREISHTLFGPTPKDDARPGSQSSPQPNPPLQPAGQAGG